jgi:peptidoglycan biosynthesis protein MviN/MurJ (putative lipid II flippase)
MANLIMTVILINIRGPVSWWVNASLFDRVSWLLLIITAGMSVYFVALYLLGLRASFLKLKHK